MVKEGFINATGGGLTEEQIENNCRQHFNEIKEAI